jgi:beta-lactamase class D
VAHGSSCHDLPAGGNTVATRRVPETMTKRSLTLLLAIAAACSAAGPEGHPTPAEPPTPAPQAEAPPPAEARFEAGEAMLAAAGLTGAFVVRRTGEPTLVMAFPELAHRGFVPASTFKIPNTLIGLETGVIPDETFTLPWDGVRREIEAWNRDQDLTSAMAESVVWYYQEVARRVGLERMASWVARLGFGNAQIGDRVDSFWLDGPLAITPIEQVEFLERLTAGQLPVAARSVEILRRVVPSRELSGATLHAKTGTHVGDGESHGWLVGWVEQEGHVTACFALLVEGEGEQVPSRDVRWELAGRLLEAAGVLTPSRT